jgi:hypothetical protein
VPLLMRIGAAKMSAASAVRFILLSFGYGL